MCTSLYINIDIDRVHQYLYVLINFCAFEYKHQKIDAIYASLYYIHNKTHTVNCSFSHLIEIGYEYIVFCKTWLCQVSAKKEKDIVLF